MYIRIVSTRDGAPKQTLLEADRLDVHPLPEEPHQILLDVGEDTSHHRVHKAHDSVYVMNGDGKTVDTYEWPVQPTGKNDSIGEDICTGDEVAVQQGLEDYRSGQVKKKDGEFVVEFNGDADPQVEPIEPIPEEKIFLLTALEERAEDPSYEVTVDEGFDADDLRRIDHRKRVKQCRTSANPRPTGKKTGQDKEVRTGDKIAFKQSGDNWRTGDVKKRDGQFVVDVEGDDPPASKDLAPLQPENIIVLADAGQDVEDTKSVEFKGQERKVVVADGQEVPGHGAVYHPTEGKLRLGAASKLRHLRENPDEYSSDALSISGE